MANRSQLVVRTSSKEGVAIIERVKALAQTRGVTISDLSLSLMEQAMNGTVSGEAPADADDSKEDPVEVAHHVRSPEAPKRASKAATSSKKTPEPKAEEPAVETEKVYVPPTDLPELSEPVDVFVKRAITLLLTQGPDEAAAALTGFFSAADPADGGRLREELQDQLRKSEYDDLLEKLQQTEEYKEYRKRVVYG